MGDAAPVGDARRFLTFRLGQRRYALPAEEVSEIIRTPSVARVPQAPRSLMGMANLRGDVLPVASLRDLLGGERDASASPARAIVLSGDAPVALAVDTVDALVTVAAGSVQTGQSELAAEAGEVLRGAFQRAASGDVIKVLDIQRLLAAAFAPRARAP